MEIITQLIEQIQNIMLYFVEGYLFITLFRFASYKTKETFENKVRLLGCVVASFVIKAATDILIERLAIPIGTGKKYILLLCVIGIITGYISGVIVRKRWFGNLLSFIGVHRTANTDIWNDVIADDRPTWVRMQLKDNGLYYYGMIDTIQETTNEPIVSIMYYEIYDNKNNKIREEKERDDVLLLNTKDFEVIEVVYGDKITIKDRLHKIFKTTESNNGR